MCWTTQYDNHLQPLIAEDDMKVLKLLSEDLKSPFQLNFHYILNENAPYVPIKLEISYWQKEDIINDGYHSFNINHHSILKFEELTEKYLYKNSVFPEGSCLFEAIIPKGTKYYENEYGAIVSETIRIVKKVNHNDYDIPVIPIDFDVLMEDGSISKYYDCILKNTMDKIIGLNISPFNPYSDDAIFVSTKKEDYKEGNYHGAEKEPCLFKEYYISYKFHYPKFFELIEKVFNISPKAIWAKNTYDDAIIINFNNKKYRYSNTAWIPKVLQWKSEGIIYSQLATNEFVGLSKD